VAVKMTVKETVSKKQPNPIYSIQTLEIAKPTPRRVDNRLLDVVLCGAVKDVDLGSQGVKCHVVHDCAFTSTRSINNSDSTRTPAAAVHRGHLRHIHTPLHRRHPSTYKHSFGTPACLSARPVSTLKKTNPSVLKKLDPHAAQQVEKLAGN
jgi:hypothetical protein